VLEFKKNQREGKIGAARDASDVAKQVKIVRRREGEWG
jgi:hypothetical protein